MVEQATNPVEQQDEPLPDPFVVSTSLRRRLQSCYEKAIKLTEQDEYDHDYVHTMLTECVMRDPNNLVYVESFLDNLAAKYNNNKRGARLKGFGGKGAFKKLVSKEEWAEILKSGPDLLKTNPWDAQILRAMADACAAFHYNEVELRYLKNALEGKPKDPDVNRHCARSLERMGIFSQAIACWHRVEEACPKDPEPPKMISDLTVRQRSGNNPELEATRSRAKANEAKARSTPSPSMAPPEEEPVERQIELTKRQELERALVENPSDIDTYLELAELHVGEQRPNDAERVLQKALQASGNNPKVREKLEDASIESAKQQVVIAEQRLASKRTEESVGLVKKLKSDLNRLELEVFNSRAQRYPDEHEFKYELGLRLKRAGNLDQAIDQLNAARADKALSCLATIEIGECLQHAKKYGKALRQYLSAAESADENDQKKLALYRAGVLATGLREFDLARRSLTELVELDSGYKDATARLDKLESISDKE